MWYDVLNGPYPSRRHNCSLLQCPQLFSKLKRGNVRIALLVLSWIFAYVTMICEGSEMLGSNLEIGDEKLLLIHGQRGI